jgi:hypothetical protein
MNKYLSELTDDKATDYSLWKVTKRMKRLHLHNPPIRTPERTGRKTTSKKLKRLLITWKKLSNQAKIKTDHSYWNK